MSATFVANAGIPIRIDSRHAIAHDEVVIVDSRTVRQGSFNFTKAAGTAMEKNVPVNWNVPRLQKTV